MSNHTPGPWQVLDRDLGVNGGRGLYIVSEREVTPTLAKIRDVGSATEANARLFAWAPELLQACDWADTAFAVLNLGGDEITPQARAEMRDAWALVNHAMARAKGRDDPFAEVNPEVSKAAIEKARREMSGA